MNGLPFDTMVQWLTEDGHLVDRITIIGAPLAQEVAGACVDSRLARPGCLFVALPGERTDGHLFVDHAVQSGASCALVAADRLAAVRRTVFGSVRLLPVDDTLAALQSLAGRWRRRFPHLTRVGITGSNGKTSTKELVASILGCVAPTVHSHGNYNSDIGLPMELLRIRESHRYGVFELGMNRPGEIRLLAELVEPDLAIITNIGRAHIGMIGSQEGIAREKREIFSVFTGTQTALIPAADRFADFLADDVNGTVVRFSMESAGVREIVGRGIDGSTLVCDEGDIHLRLPGPEMATNALAAITAARLLDAPFQAIRDGIERVAPVFGRAEVIRGGITVIQDCYNANPESMRSALDLLAQTTTPGRRVAVLGAMKELGDQTTTGHREIARYASSLALDAVILVGDEFVALYEGADADDLPAGWRVFPTADWSAVLDAAAALRHGDLVLLKGSRALALERLTPVIVERGGAA